MRRDERGSNARISRIITRSVTPSMRLKIEVERLFPEIPDEIILDQVVPRLPWGTLHMMSSVNRRWRQAMQRREIYDARVRSHSTDTMVVIKHGVLREGEAVSLYSVRDNSWYQLPQFPKSQNSQREVSASYQCASIDGKIYVLGGVNKCPDGYHRDGMEACREVYVLDLAGRREWKQCTNMPEPRYAFGCGVMDRKIFIFGGRTSGGKYIRESVVYDPIENSWSSIMPMQKERSHSEVVATGKMLFVQGGDRHDLYGLGTSEIYHPGKDEFELRSLLDPPYHERSKLFMAQGKLYKMTPTAIYVRSIDSVSNDIFKNYFCPPLHTFGAILFADTHREYSNVDGVCAIQAVNGELLVLACSDGPGQKEFLQSKGFGSEKENILWETVPSGILKKQRYPHFLCSIEL